MLGYSNLQKIIIILYYQLYWILDKSSITMIVDVGENAENK